MEKIVMGFKRMRFVVHVEMRKLCGCRMEKLRGGCREL
jgi:hypothetical protein